MTRAREVAVDSAPCRRRDHSGCRRRFLFLLKVERGRSGGGGGEMSATYGVVADRARLLRTAPYTLSLVRSAPPNAIGWCRRRFLFREKVERRVVAERQLAGVADRARLLRTAP
jgi:hypothetical protein